MKLLLVPLLSTAFC